MPQQASSIDPAHVPPPSGAAGRRRVHVLRTMIVLAAGTALLFAAILYQRDSRTTTQAEEWARRYLASIAHLVVHDGALPLNLAPAAPTAGQPGVVGMSWLERGVSIGQVKGLLSEPQAQPVSDHWQQTLEQFSQALLAFNQRKAEAELNDLLASYPFELVRSRVLQPLVERLLGLWRERPDGELLQQVWLGWLHTRFARHLIEQEKGVPVTLGSWGQVGPLDLVWAAYELIGQGHEVQLLGAVEPRHASLLEGRAVTPWLVLLGAGLGKPVLAAGWPAGTRFFGELGRLYDDEWLKAHGWQASLAEVMADMPAAAGAGGRGRKKS